MIDPSIRRSVDEALRHVDRQQRVDLTLLQHRGEGLVRPGVADVDAVRDGLSKPQPASGFGVLRWRADCAPGAGPAGADVVEFHSVLAGWLIYNNLVSRYH